MNRSILVAAVLVWSVCRELNAAAIGALAFSADGKILASSGHKKVDLRSSSDAALLDSVACPFPRVTSLAFSRDGRLIVGGGIPGARGAVAILDLKTKTTLRELTGYRDLVTSVALSADGQWLAIGSVDHSAVLEPFPENSTNETVRLSGHSGPVLTVAITPASDLVITAGADRSIKIWNLKGELIRSMNQHTETIHTLAVRPPRQSGLAECASGSDDRTVRIWQPEIGRMVRIVRGHAGAIFALAFNADGSALFSAGKEGIVRQLDPDSDAVIREQKMHADAIYSLAVSPNGDKVVSGDWAGNIRIWNLLTE